MTHTQREALATVVHYLTDAEEADYRARPAEEQREHIYGAVLQLQRLLDEEREVPAQ